MATLNTTESSASYVPHDGRVVFGGADMTSVSIFSISAGRQYVEGCKLTILPVNTIATTETLVTGIKGIVSVAWQADDVDADRASVFVSDVATGTLTFSENETGAIEGWVWILHKG